MTQRIAKKEASYENDFYEDEGEVETSLAQRLSKTPVARIGIMEFSRKHGAEDLSTSKRLGRS